MKPIKITSTHILLIVIVLIFVLIAAKTFLQADTTENTEAISTAASVTALATCISASGAKFYGAFWCPHCKKQKALFGAAVSKLPYIECSTPDEKSQTQVCINVGIKEYPTWEFASGVRVSGVQSLKTLAQKTNCPYPG